MGQVDDDGLDGLVYLRAMEVDSSRPTDRRTWKHQFTGGLIHVQVKSGASYIVTHTLDHIEISFRNLDKKRELWQKSPLPVALVYVKEERVGRTPKCAWWVDLKTPDSYTSTGSILIPLKNRFQEGIECRRPFERLAIGQHRRLNLATLDMTCRGDLPNKLDQMSKGKKAAAIDFYRQWKLSKPTNPDLGQILVNRTGWSHITRVNRPVSRIQTSFDLLPTAARIVSEVIAWQVLRRGATARTFKDGSWAIYDYIGLSAMAKWPARAPSEVMVILRRQTTFTTAPTTEPLPKTVSTVERKTWFYSVYEPGRRKQ